MLTSINNTRLEANRLRKSREFDKALRFYRELYADSPDPYNTAGLMHCLRKLDLFDEAIPLCDFVFDHFRNDEWCKNEAIWTLIKGKLEKLEDTASLQQVSSIVERILQFCPTEPLTVWRIIRPVLKTAKTHGKWDVVSNWIDKIDPQDLPNKPMTDSNGREGWSHRSIWHNYKVRSMIEVGDNERAIIMARECMTSYPRQRYFFARLEALATFRLPKIEEAEKLYASLCKESPNNWWVLSEYAQVLKALGNKEHALKMMCKAASINGRLPSLVSLLFDIATLCIEIGDKVTARNHYLLCKFIRLEQGWAVPYTLDKALEGLEDVTNKPLTRREAFSRCEQFWASSMGQEKKSRGRKPVNKKPRTRLIGNVSLGSPDHSYCFISINGGESFFSYKSDLPSNTVDGTELIFDAVPSYDKKKGRESWRAINIRSI